MRAVEIADGTAMQSDNAAVTAFFSDPAEAMGPGRLHRTPGSMELCPRVSAVVSGGRQRPRRPLAQAMRIAARHVHTQRGNDALGRGCGIPRTPPTPRPQHFAVRHNWHLLGGQPDTGRYVCVSCQRRFRTLGTRIIAAPCRVPEGLTCLTAIYDPASGALPGSGLPR